MINMNEIQEIYNIEKYLCNRLTELHWIYSHRLFSDSVVTVEKTDIIRLSHKEHIVVLDRNIFSRLIQILTEGATREGATKDVAILISWCIILDLKILPYFAINEYSIGNSSEELGQKEFDVFDKMYSEIEPKTWFALALGLEEKNVKLITSSDKEIDVRFNDESVDFVANYAAMLHLANVCRSENESDKRFKAFFKWYYDNMKVSRYVVVYVCAVLAGKRGYSYPKQINSNDIEKVIKGCRNQAMDLTYMTSLSIDRIDSDEYEMIIVSDDEMFGQIFLQGYNNINPLYVYQSNITKGSTKIREWINELLDTHCEINVHGSYIDYCKAIVKDEEKMLSTLIGGTD